MEVFNKDTMKLTTLILIFFLNSCGTDGSEVFILDDEIPHYVIYNGGMWKFENGQRYWLKSIDQNSNFYWEVG